MREPIVYVGIGFLLAIFLAIGMNMLARLRATRSARRWREIAPPPLMSDIETDMNQLHSQIAVATRRLEISVEQMKARSTSQLAEIGKSSEAIARLKGELAEKNAAFIALQDKEKALGSRILATEAEFEAKNRSLQEIEETLSRRKAELANFLAEYQVHPELAKERNRHAAEMEALKADKALVEEQLEQSRDECALLRGYIESMRQQVETTWASERMANAVLRERINDVASEVVRVAAALEGLNSPIDTLVAGKAASLQSQADQNPGDTLDGQNLLPAFVDGGNPSSSELIHRIRALRKRSAQISATG